MNTADNLPNIIQTFPTNKDQLPDSTVYKAKINHYSPIVCSRDPQTIGAVLYEALIAHFAKVWEELYLAKKNNGELKQIKITWWESSGAHHAVDAEFYLENWRANYSTLAENWREISSTPNAINRISERIIKGIAGLLYVAEYEDTIFATLKYSQQTYQRADQSIIGKPISKYRDKYWSLVEEIAGYASSLPFYDGINFLSELSGACILSCPAKYIESSSLYQDVSRRNTTYSIEEKHVMVLLKYVCEYGSQEFAMSASEFPLHFIQRPGEKWKFVIEIPDAH